MSKNYLIHLKNRVFGVTILHAIEHTISDDVAEEDHAVNCFQEAMKHIGNRSDIIGFEKIED